MPRSQTNAKWFYNVAHEYQEGGEGSLEMNWGPVTAKAFPNATPQEFGRRTLEQDMINILRSPWKCTWAFHRPVTFLKVEGQGETIFGRLRKEDTDFEWDICWPDGFGIADRRAMNRFCVGSFQRGATRCFKVQQMTCLPSERWTWPRSSSRAS